MVVVVYVYVVVGFNLGGGCVVGGGGELGGDGLGGGVVV